MLDKMVVIKTNHPFPVGTIGKVVDKRLDPYEWRPWIVEALWHGRRARFEAAELIVIDDRLVLQLMLRAMEE